MIFLSRYDIIYLGKKAEERPIITEYFSIENRVKTLSPIEIYGSKINALLVGLQQETYMMQGI